MENNKGRGVIENDALFNGTPNKLVLDCSDVYVCVNKQLVLSFLTLVL